ncbi:carbonic anhydrase 9-like [Copidosoma floridanum]|uniref:carbonic anhydrase 9-like n=1 Tax=Copidosoma floridanum TaxID=29053 RepID=UPI000C6F7109|nr:carbonic anhydrase 9-like [Copidosoma floridanum]
MKGGRQQVTKNMRLTLIVFLVMNSFLLDHAKPGSYFDYSQPGQDRWVRNYPLCAGGLQSPIPIAASRSVALPLPALEMIGYHDYLQPPFTLRNNGHTVVLKIKDESIRKRTPYIFGVLLKENDKFELESLHFHWGLKNGRGSEHVLHGTRRVNISFFLNFLTTAKLKFLEEEENRHLSFLIPHLKEVQNVNSESRLNNSIELSTLLPVDVDTYYTYKGSLTTPPCNEVVTWTVFAATVPVSFKQMNKFRLLSDGKGILADNFRYLQNVQNRKIYVRRPNATLMGKNEIIDFDPSNLKWHWT